MKVLKINKNIALEINTRSAIISLKSNWKRNEETLKLRKELLDLIKSNKQSFFEYKETYLFALFNLSAEYLINKNYKEGLNTSIIGIRESLSYKDTIMYYEFVSNTGTANYYLGNYQLAIDSLQKGLPYEDEHGKAMSNYYLGKSYTKLSKPQLAQYHFLQTDSIYQSTQDIFPELRDTYENIIDYYKSKGDTDNQLRFIDKLLAVDKKLDATYKYVTEEVYQKYDRQQLVAQKEALQDTITSYEKSWWYYVGSVLIILALAASGLWWYFFIVILLFVYK